VVLLVMLVLLAKSKTLNPLPLAVSAVTIWYASNFSRLRLVLFRS
jgi:hypothetical protein